MIDALLKKKLYGLVSPQFSLEFSGPDVELFLQGQLTNNVSTLINNSFQFTARLDRSGRILYWGLLRKVENRFVLEILDSSDVNPKRNLENFIIMEDVSIKEQKSSFILTNAGEDIGGEKTKGHFLGLPLYLLNQTHDNVEMDMNWDWKTSLLFPHDISSKKLILNETILLLCALSRDKGCYVGQETVNKIINGRGANIFPCYLRSEKNLELDVSLTCDGELAGLVSAIIEPNLYYAQIKREFRLDNRFEFTQEGETFEVEIATAPIKVLETTAYYLEKLVQWSSQELLQQEIKKAEQLLLRALAEDENYLDALESLGALYGKVGRLDEAKKCMLKMLEIDSDLVMPHTNLSIFHLQEGNVELAEEHKAKAMMNSFKQKSPEEKSNIDQDKKRKKEMFEKVLAIDPTDSLANFSLGKIFFEESLWIKALNHLSRAIEGDKKYSVAYLYKAKCLLSLNESSEAKATLDQGIKVATKNGDLMPANEMVQIQNQLNS